MVRISVAQPDNLSFYSSIFTIDTKPPLVDLLQPLEGSSYMFTDPLLVKWDASDDSFGTGPVSVFLSTDGGSNYTTLGTGLPNIDSALLTIPEVITDSAKVKILVQDNFGLTAEDYNNGFFTLDGIILDLKAFLEGPYAGNGMLAYLNFFDYLPFNQPFSGAPWYYSGTESVTAIPSDDVIDWVLLELRDAASASSATSATRIARKAALLVEDGRITGLDGIDKVKLGNLVNDGLYVIVWHRNHLGIMSANALVKSGGMYSYDFTDASSKVYGGSFGYKQMVSGKWAMISGDGNADGQVTNADKVYIWNPQTGTSGYKSGDFNMDGNVNITDKISFWRPNTSRSTQVPQ